MTFATESSNDRFASQDAFVLKIDVLSIADLGTPQSRIGDAAAKKLGGQVLQPYIVVQCGSVKRQTAVFKNRDASPSLHVPLPRDVSDRPLRDAEVYFQVFDARGVQSMMRGDPLIGEAGISLGEESLGAPNVRTICLKRNKPNGTHSMHGSLVVRVGVLAPDLAYDVLASCPNRPLAQVLKAMSQILVQPLGVVSLLNARPAVVLKPPNLDEMDFRERMQTWIIQLDTFSRTLQGWESDDTTIWHVARVMQTFQEFVEICMQDQATAVEVEQAALDWLQCFIDNNVLGKPASLDQERLRRLVQAGSVNHESVRKHLADFGVRLPKGTGKGLEFLILARLVEAEQTNEVDIFTSESIISDGVASSGLAMVLLPGQNSGGPRAYLYNSDGIMRWRAEHGSDPTTREPISSNDIIPLTVRLSPRRLAVDAFNAIVSLVSTWISKVACSNCRG